MGAPGDIEFDDDVQRRIYRHVERSGTTTVDDVRDEIRVPAPAGSKPARSGTTEPRVRLPPEEFRDHVDAMVEAGHLVERDGTLHLAFDEGTEEYTEGDLTYRIRPARESDRRGIEAAIREVAEEGTSIAGERVAAEIDEQGALLRHNDRKARMFFVGEVASDEDGGDEWSDGEGEIAGWVHVDAPELDKLRHTGELTVGVRERYREHGIGSRLLERAIDWADEANYRKVYQSVPATNETAIDLLQDHGWETEAVREDHYLVGEEFVDEVMMAREP
ncbi:N-acetyltransferase family protein [Halomicrococcus sp. NG-SE-24]|uniref:GNAT family N-acetyltransferase n=1 Tax=Halomicrococcus sp. NG-SE-24 TaxID=3436928 RepID=UPI003D99C65A